MLFSRKNIWAVANIICWGTQVDASSHRRRRDEAPPPTRRELADYFQTTWELPQVWPIYVTQTVLYNVSNDVVASGEGRLPLILLWTDVQAGVPTADNTWQLFEVKPYVCDGGDGQCDWKKDKTGSATFGISPNQNQDIWKTGAFFLCFATPRSTVQSDSAQQLCRSFSKFFTLQSIPQAAPGAAGLIPRQGGTPANIAQLVVPTAALPVSKTTDIVVLAGAAVTAAPTNPASTTTQPNLSLSLSTNADGSVSTKAVVSETPKTTVTVTPGLSSTSLPTAPSVSKSKSGLPMGAIIGIAIGGAAILIAILIFAFLCYRRRRRTQTPSEQVLLADNMTHHPHSLEKLDVDVSNHSAGSGMLGSILETRPSSGPYDHLQSSAPYAGPLGPHRRSNSGQLSVTPIPTALARGVSDASARTPVSPRSTLHGNDARSLNRRSIDTRSVSMYDEPYQDVPVFGETRHVPQVYNTHNAPFLSQSPTPFLSEPGMSQEEIERLEEEERRIDAAIAEAERRR